MKKHIEMILENLRDHERDGETDRPPDHGESLRVLLIRAFVAAAGDSGAAAVIDSATSQAMLDAATGGDDLGHVGTQRQYALALWSLADLPAVAAELKQNEKFIARLAAASGMFYTPVPDPLPGGVALAVE